MSVLIRRVGWLGFVATSIPIILLPLLVASDAVARKLFAFIFPGTIDVTEYAIVIITFMAGPWILRLGGHTRVDALLNISPPRIRLPLQTAGFIIGAVISGLMAWEGFSLVVRTFREGTVLEGYFTVPAFWIYLVIPLGALLYAVEFCRLVRDSARATIGAYRRSPGPSKPDR